MEIVHPKVGDRVRVRQRTWLVQEVDGYDRCRVLSLAPGDAAASPRRIIQPFDDVATDERRLTPVRASTRAWRRACRTLIAHNGDASSLLTAASARVDLLPYQLEPALAILRGAGARLLLADDVGLGKTVQAMLAVAELLARGIARRVLVLCPAGLRMQWAEECLTRFGLTLAPFDQLSIRRLKARLPIRVNPWSTASLVVASIDFVKRPETLPLVLDASWDAVVVDEAHGSSGASDRREAVARLCERTPYVLLLTATPHNGDETSFLTLCGFGSHADPLVVFKRSRLEVGRDQGRHVHILRVQPTGAEQRMYAALHALTRAVRLEWTAMNRDIWLMLSLLHKRALSCPFALAASVERRLEQLEAGVATGSVQLLLPLYDGSGEQDAADVAPIWTGPALRDAGRERRLLERLASAARTARADASKFHRLRRLLARVGEPVIVFTEYRDTLLHLHQQVAPHAVIIHGGLTLEQRRAAVAAFPSAGCLLATDAASEGLNLQRECRMVVNLELPWNPMRLEQRIGRVDRIGQERRVHVSHLIASGTGETELLGRLSSRVSRAQARVGAADPMCGRPAWTEEASARLVVLQDDSRDADASTVKPPSVPLTRLSEEASRETTRLRLIRSMSPRDAAGRIPAAAESAPLVARTRHRRSRLHLAGKLIAFVRLDLLDADGRRVASRVVPLACPVRPGALSILVAAESMTWLLNEPACTSWLDETTRVHEQMTRVWVHRAQAILRMVGDTRSEYQPGLFDRRVEDEQGRQRRARLETLARAEECVARAQAARAVRVAMPRLSVVLFAAPGGWT